MTALESSAKKPVNLSLNEALVRESRAYCGNLSAKVEEMLQAYVEAQRQARSHVWFRWFNEAPVLLLLAAVILVVVKPF